MIAAIADQQGVNIREIGPIVIEASDPDLDATLGLQCNEQLTTMWSPEQ